MGQTAPFEFFTCVLGVGKLMSGFVADMPNEQFEFLELRNYRHSLNLRAKRVEILFAHTSGDGRNSHRQAIVYHFNEVTGCNASYHLQQRTPMIAMKFSWFIHWFDLLERTKLCRLRVLACKLCNFVSIAQCKHGHILWKFLGCHLATNSTLIDTTQWTQIILKYGELCCGTSRKKNYLLLLSLISEKAEILSVSVLSC